MAGMRIGGGVEKTSVVAAKKRDERIEKLAAANMAAKESASRVNEGQLQLNERAHKDTMADKQMQRGHESEMQFGEHSNQRRMQTSTQMHEKGMQRDKQKFIGGEADKDRSLTTDQKDLDRKHDLDVQKNEVAGKAFIGGLSGDKAQQIQSSSSGNIDYKGMEMPRAESKAMPWEQIQEADEDGNKSVTGTFNKQTGERKYFIGGSQPANDDLGALSKDQLIELATKNPQKYEELKKRYLQ